MKTILLITTILLSQITSLWGGQSQVILAMPKDFADHLSTQYEDLKDATENAQMLLSPVGFKYSGSSGIIVEQIRRDVLRLNTSRSKLIETFTTSDELMEKLRAIHVQINQGNDESSKSIINKYIGGVLEVHENYRAILLNLADVDPYRDERLFLEKQMRLIDKCEESVKKHLEFTDGIRGHNGGTCDTFRKLKGDVQKLLDTF